MAVTFKPKTSSVPGAIPSLGQLADGEIAINFFDKIIYQRVGSTIQAISEPETLRNIIVDNRVPWLNIFPYTQGTTRELTFDPLTQQANTVLAGPSIKSTSGQPEFRALTLSDIPLPRDYISGMSIRTNNTQIIISQGGAVLSNGAYVEHPGQIINNSRTANSKYYLYLLSNGIVERTTSVPSTPFFGSARASTQLGVKRYIGSVCTDAFGNYLNQWSDFGGNQVTVQFVLNTTAITSLISNGTSTTPADLSMAQWLYGDAVTQVMLRLYHNGTGGTARLYTWNGTAFVIFTNIQVAGNTFVVPIMPDNTPKIQYDVVGTGAQVAIILMGYMYAR